MPRRRKSRIRFTKREKRIPKLRRKLISCVRKVEKRKYKVKSPVAICRHALREIKQ